MRRFLALCLAGVVLAGPAWAAVQPQPLKSDRRMRTVTYNADDVVHLSTAVGATLVVQFAPTETVASVAATDSADLKAQPQRNFLFFKPVRALPVQPVVVLTSRQDGSMRRYVFEFETTPDAQLGADAADAYYSVQFLYPDDARAAALAAAKVRRAEAAKVQAAVQAQRAHDVLEAQASDPMAGTRNWRYIAQGDRAILPLEVFDNGNSTVFRFPGNTRMPSVYTINPDGTEATASYSVKGDLLIVNGTAKQFRLRDGQTVLCIFNMAFSAVGTNPGTGTISPDVVRQIKASPP